MALVLFAFAATRQRFAFTDLSMALVALFFVIQCLGGRYTFAEVPFPDALIDLFGLERNPVDRIGHFLQGVVPAIVLREFLIRRRGLESSWTLFWLVTGCCLGFSGFYEILEMAVVLVFYPDVGPEWLGMQSDPWDAQWDMTMALSGALLAQLLMGRLLDTEIARMERGRSR